jgi:hypothetical protein
MAYADSNHLFTQPVRTYKANDPYYYEVDNIPVRQLEENILWAKDQLDSLIIPSGTGKGGPLSVGDDLNLEDIKQFRPKWVGGRNITIQAGKFTGRVNDAYNIRDRLSNLATTGTLPVTEFPPGWTQDSLLPKLVDDTDGAFLAGVWHSYINTIGNAPAASVDRQQSYNDNGLETVFTFFISGRDGRPTITTQDSTSYKVPEYAPGAYSDMSYTWPVMWSEDIKSFTGLLTRDDPVLLNQIHMAITRFWRGVARTSVVDFREDTIEIPPFNELDYYYVEEINGIDQTFSLEDSATQRIDLLVVYTHPIDSSASYIQEYDEAATTPGQLAAAEPKKITSAQLGIIRGAGIGLKKLTDGTIEVDSRRLDSGKPKILANMNDHLQGTNTGIKLKSGNILKGSFPSPDDLLNLAPNLSLGLANNNLQLIGQTVLPIAYVVVNKDQTNIVQEDIIDIRPFLRTAELAYNERAGIAAAEPALSLANPAVGAAQLQGKLTELGLLSQYTPPGQEPPTTPATLGLTRTIYNDYIMGGMLWGPEGVLLMMNEDTQGPWYQTMPDRLGSGATISPAGLTGWGSSSRTNRLDYLWGLYRSQQQLAGATGGYVLTGINQNLNLQKWLVAANNTPWAGWTGGEKYLNCSPARVIPFVPEWQYQQVEPGTQGLAYSPYNDQPDRQAEKWVWHLKTGKRYLSAAYGGGDMYGCAANANNRGTWAGLSLGTYPTGATGGFTGPGGNSDIGRSDMRCLVKQFFVRIPPDAQDYDVEVAYENSIPDLYLDEGYWGGWLSPAAGGTLTNDPAFPTFSKGDGAQLTVGKSPIIHDGQGKAVFFTVIAKYPMHSWGANNDAQEFMPYTVYNNVQWQLPNQSCTGGNSYPYSEANPDGIQAEPNLRSGKCHYPTVRVKVQIYTDINKQAGHIVAGSDEGFAMAPNSPNGNTLPSVAEGAVQPPWAGATGLGTGTVTDGQINLDLQSS